MAMHSYVEAVIDAGLTLLPDEMRAVEARAMLRAIGWQESRWRYRRQHRGGPALGFFQFEPTGVQGVLHHVRTRSHLRDALKAASCAALFADPGRLHATLEWHDPLAVVLARLLLWTYPEALPAATETRRGWEQYVALWRPGRPRAETWEAAWAFGWGGPGEPT